MPSTPTLYNAWRDAQLTYLSGNFLYGDADIGSTVELSNNGIPFQTVSVLTGGFWHSNDVPFPDGTYHVTAVSIDAAGLRSSPTPVLTFKVDNTAPLAPTVTLLDPGIRDTTPTMYTGSAEPGSEVIMDFGQGLQLYAIANSDGIWNVSSQLADGNYQISVLARDAANNRSAPVQLTLNRQSADDAGSNAATAGAMVVGLDKHAALDFSGDVDWFKINLSSLTTYSFAMKGVRAGGGTLAFEPGLYSDTYLQLWDPRADGGHGAFVRMNNIGASGGDPIMSANIGVGGDFYLVASATRQLGSYTLSALATSNDDYFDDAAHATPITIGTVLNGQFDHAGDIDAFKVDLVAGTTYVFDLGPGAGTGDTSSLSIELSDSAHSTVNRSSYNLERHAYLSYTAMSSGSYSLSLGNFFNTGTYVFKATAPADDYGASIANHGNLAIGTTVAGKLETSGDRDWFGVTLNAGTAYTFILDAGPYGNPSLTVFDALGGTLNLSTRDMNAGKVLTWTPTVSGTYFLDVGNSFGTTTNYTLLAELSERDDAGATAADARTLTIDAPATGRIELPGDVDWFKISMKANVMYTFDVQAVPQTTVSYAYGLSSTVVDAAGHTLSTTLSTSGNSLTAFQPAVSGDYYLAVAGRYKIFDYSIASFQNDQDIYLASTATTGKILPGGLVRSALDFLGDSDWFKADLQAGQNYRFQLSRPDGSVSGISSSTLTLYDANGGYVGSGYYDYNAISLTYTATKSASFFISVNGGTGGYLLKEATDKIPYADTTPPNVYSLRAPEFRGDDPATANLTLNFSEPVVLGSGSITLRLANGNIVETFAAGSARVTLDSSGANLTIDPSAPLLSNTDYRLDVSANAITDKVGLPLSSDYTKTFHTAMGALNVVGGSGNDLWVNTAGSDIIDGGAGTDTMRYLGQSADYVISANGAQGWIVSPKAGGTEHDSLINVERVIFNDSARAFDITGTAGQAYRLYQAAFNRVPDAAGLGYWISQMDKGISLHATAESFLTSAEFTALYGAAPNNEAFVAALYNNVLHRAAEQGGHDYWMDALQHGVPRADVLAAFSESAENQAAIIGTISNGINYVPYG